MLPRRAALCLRQGTTRNYAHASRPVFYPRLRPLNPSRELPKTTTEAAVVDSSLSDNGDSTADEGQESPGDVTTNGTKTIPWFMEYNKQFDDDFPHQQRHTEPLPDIPKDSPSITTGLLQYLSHDLVLQDLRLLDLRERENPWGSDTIMVLATARSERQLRSAAESLKGHLRGLGCKPRVDGLINWENTKVKRRRRRKMIGRANYQVEDDRLHWLIVDVGGGTGLILQLFSEKGREEYALEELWGRKGGNEVLVPQPRSELPTTVLPSSTNNNASRLGPLSRRLFSAMRSLPVMSP